MPELRPDQKRIIRDGAQTKVLAMGRRWGKTTLGGAYALACARRGAAVAWVVPTYRNARPLWRFCEQRTAAVSDRIRSNRAEMMMEFPGGGRVGIYSAENDTSLRGEAFHVVIVDEAAQIKPETYTDVIMPTLADYNGHCILISTPRGLNWFYSEFQRGQTPGQGQSAFHAPTSANPKPNIQRAFQAVKSRVPERTYRQEWLAEFVEDSGIVFRNVDALATAEQQTAPLPNHTYVGGIDWGRFNDATVFTVADATTRELVYVDRMIETEFQLQLARLKALHARFAPTVWIAEDNSIGGPQVEALQAADMPVRAFTTTNATKAHIIDALALAFEQGTIRVIPDPVLVGELKAYAATRLPSGTVRYGAPEGMHDDHAMSAALAWHGVDTPSGSDLLAI